jgi:hypothetical protein
MNRQETEFRISSADGITKICTLVPYVTPDDIALLSMKAIAAEIKFGMEYQTPATREVRDHLILTRVTQRS